MTSKLFGSFSENFAYICLKFVKINFTFMIIEPRIRGFICLTTHLKGCEQNVINQINYVKSKNNPKGTQKGLIIGASTGFGLASRITSAFGSGAATLGVYFEKPPA